MRMEQSLRGVEPGLNSTGGMASTNLFNPEGNHSGNLLCRHGGDQGESGSKAVETESRENSQGDEDQGERWFQQENSRVEIRTLARMEDDLNSTLLFEHGGGQRASQIWIVRILLGRLSQD